MITKLTNSYRQLLTICLVFVLSFMPSSTCFAKAAPIEHETEMVGEGYTEDGIYYSIYLAPSDPENTADINTIIKREHTLNIMYHGDVTPASVLRNQKIVIDGVEYHGDLYLQSWNYEPRSILNPTGEYTSATYKGTLYANI